MENMKIKIEYNKEFAYMLGLIWADGHIAKDGKSVMIETVKDDMDYFSKILDKTGKWSYYNRVRNNWKPQVKAYIYQSSFHLFLSQMDFDKKSYLSPNKILDILDNDLLRFFVLGVIDGDGCFYFNKKNYTRQFSITGTYDQDWSFYENIFQLNGIKYKIKRNDKKSKYSQIRICDKKSLILLGNYLYGDSDIGLPRKIEKYRDIIY